jgi:iron complex outermembrane receptor protein
MKILASGIAVLISGALLPITVGAQTAVAEQELQEVVVTAERVASKAQDTPIAMSIYSAEDLTDKGLVDIGSLAKFDPSLHFTGTSESYITLRGITSTDTTESGDPAVPVAFDDFYTNRPLSHFGTLYDMERVEVLRGPQGTLFGRNAVGGVINAYTAKPKNSFEANGSVELGNYNALNMSGMFNTPLGDTVSLRAAFATVSHDGYRVLEPVGLKGDDADMKSARVQLAWAPNDKFKVSLLYQSTRIGGVGPVGEQLNYTYFTANGIGTGSPICVLSGCAPDHVTPAGALDDPSVLHSNIGNTLNIRNNTARLRMEYLFANGLSLSYLGGYDDLDWLTNVEVSRRDLPLSGRTPAGLSGPDWFRQHERPKTWNHELRVVSATDKALSWQAGAFYFKESSKLLSERIDKPFSTTENRWLKFDYPKLEAESKAVYGHVSYRATDQIRITAGLRNTKDTKSRFGRVIIFNNPAAVVVPAGKLDNSQTTYHVGVDWKLNDDTLIYVKTDKGYKSGGYTNTAQYGPEILLAYEAGFKTTFNKRIQLNAAAFSNDYKDQQIALLGANVALGTQIFNAGKSKIDGLEVDLTALVGSSSEVGLHGTFINGKYKDFVLTNGSNTCPRNVVPNTAPACNIQLAGNKPIQTPDVSLSANLDHTFHGFAGGALTASLDARYNGEAFFSPFNYASSKIKAYTLLDFALKYVPEVGNWEANAYVRNLTDESYFTDFGEQQVSGIETYNYSYSPPRTIGVRFNYRWK